MKKLELIIVKNSFFKKLINKIKNFFFKKRIDDVNVDEEIELESLKDLSDNDKLDRDDLLEESIETEENEDLDNAKGFKKHIFDTYSNVREGKTKIDELDDVDLLFVNRFMQEELELLKRKK